MYAYPVMQHFFINNSKHQGTQKPTCHLDALKLHWKKWTHFAFKSMVFTRK